MNTALSLPAELLERAEETAVSMGIPRNQLIEVALEEFIENHNGNRITEKLNEVYDKTDQTEFDRFLSVSLESLRSVTKNDAW